MTRMLVMKQTAATTRYNHFLPSHLALLKSPPSYLALTTAIIISIGILFAIIWSYIGKLDIQATTQGRLVVSGRTQVIQAFELSRLQHIYVADGQHVKQGDPLLSVNVLGINQDIHNLNYQIHFQQIEKWVHHALLNQISPELTQEFAKLLPTEQQRLLESYQSLKNEYDALLNEIDNEITLNRTHYSARERELKDVNTLIINIQKRLDAHRVLNNQQLISQKEFLEQERELLMAKKEKTSKLSELAILNSQHSALHEKRHRLQTQKTQEWYEKYRQAEFKLVSAEQELLKNQEREQLKIIRSPVDGTVQQLATYTLGAVLQPAQQLMVVVPNNDVQLAEVKILNKDIGFIREGQLATVKIDAFPYTRYGTIDGEVISISRDSTQDEQLGLVFLGQIGLKKKSLLVEGNHIELTPGLSVTAEIKTEKRRVIDYLLSPIQEYTTTAMREK
ncbi:TPA: HlyD family type I secretion periplasmic adaptor subunit [Providencia stuartii]|nr:hemolysin D [Providencia stuartii]AVL39297.1 HlyD family type I secretion periplasmic adaptor subunit [Providencia stuartii]KNZ85565.1 hemolysin D [Providencia stuartii]MBG5903657.1 HlyD family type I secretion periplasmic adaptor subunit [Providencia stuartii]MBG5911198.1 HlyD family type I secretion periplasmic adaptor subunit [Providencia stuartii]